MARSLTPPELEYTYPRWTHRGTLTSSGGAPNNTTAGEETLGDHEDAGPGEQSPNTHGSGGERPQNEGNALGDRQGKPAFL